MGHKAIDSFPEHALEILVFAMFVAKLLSQDDLRNARSLQQRQAMNKDLRNSLKRMFKVKVTN